VTDFDLSSEQDWVKFLPSFQVSAINGLLEEGLSEDEVIDLWLGKPVVKNNAPFGATEFSRDFSEKFRVEFRKFICGGEEYDDLREEVSKLWEKNKLVVVSTIAAAIGAVLGLAVGVLTPVVAVAISIVAKLGKNAWCEMHLQS